MRRNTIIVAVLIVLVLLTAVQAIQISGLKSGSGVSNVNVASAPAQNTGNNLPSNINDLPSMVGGC